MANGNLERLVEARVIASAEALSEPERQVIDGLSAEEVDTLVGIRRKLSAAAGSGSSSPAASLSDFDSDPESGLEPEFQSNIVI